ncbi:DNA-methyltransferase [Streptomyces sp. 020-2-3H-GM]|uniref:DNA-methyltransferase n=1 Tax=Streptomyces sp. 020-2-3H-GM TaxID=2789258 RepID=UPI00398147FC
MDPYWKDEDAGLYLYLGDMREILPALDVQADLIVADPPYAETSLAWDRWPDGWPTIAAAHTTSMWCFGSMRMFLDRHDQFSDWRLSQDVVWEKHNGSGFAADRFKRVHEHALHWYRGEWRAQHRDTPTTADATKRAVRRKQRPTHTGDISRGAYLSEDGGPRLMRSVLQVRSMHGRATHPTEKPLGIIDPLIRYSCPPAGLVLDPFAGSGSTLDAARQSGRRAIGIEADERYCEAVARRLSALTLPAA